MGQKTYAVRGMTCGHCVNAVSEEIGRIDGVTGVDVTLDSGSVVVTSEGGVDDEQIRAAVGEAGYELVE